MKSMNLIKNFLKILFLYILVVVMSCFLAVTMTVMDNQYSKMKKQHTIMTCRTQGIQGDIYELNYRTGLLFSHQEYIGVESITRKNDNSVVFTVSDGSIEMDNGTAVWTHDDGNISTYNNATIRPYE